MDKPRRTGSAGVTKGMNKKKIRYIKIKEEQPKKRSSKKSRSRAAKNFGHAMTIVGTTFSAMLLILVIMVCIVATVLAVYVLDFADNSYDANLKDVEMKYTSFVYGYDEDNELVEIKRLAAEQNRVWVDYEDMPKCLIDAVVASEDKRFYTHKGVDWYRTSGALIKMFATMQNNFGGSTITQQLIKNLTGNNEVTVQRKLSEIFSALELEKNYDKQEIITWYFNAVYFGEGCYGVETAAQKYFGKDVWDLSLAESAAIVGITNKPTYYDPFYNQENNKERQETILREMYDQGYIDYDTYIAAVNEPLNFAHSPEDAGVQQIYSYYEEVVIDDVIRDLMKQNSLSYNAAEHMLKNGGYLIYSCFDPNVQYHVDNIYATTDNIPTTWGSNQQLQSAIVIMDPYTGEIKALTGGVGTKDRNFPLNRATGTYRSAGSSIKPLASYGPAIEMGYITPNTLVDDSADIYLTGTSWYPSNDGGGHFGVIDIYTALQYSVNTVAAQIIDKITPQVAYDWLTQKLGFTSLVPDDCAYAPMALGQFTNGVTVREMAQAYCSFVNDGVFTYSRTYTLVTDADGNVLLDNQPETIQAFSANTAHVMTYMLQNAVNRGTGTEAYLGIMPVAGKTGTTTDAKDRWFVGCTPYYVAAVWTGYDQPEYIRVSGNPAAQIFRKVMRPLHEGLEYKDFTWPYYIGGDTGIFGVEEEEEEEEKDAEIETPDETPEPSDNGGNTGGNTGGGDSGGSSGGGDGGSGGGDNGGSGADIIIVGGN